ncbi:MAG: hypothetical protein JW986_09910 [Methanotrichaceae archaeon]|nr:hypothetical protein [Methanotrichaceae archaeon]
MPRRLNEDDLDILRKLAPELEALICSGSGVEYRSILPPLANHISRDLIDFAGRLDRLSSDELSYLCRMILEGKESLGCLEIEYAQAFFQLVGSKVSADLAAQVEEAYESEGECYL